MSHRLVTDQLEEVVASDNFLALFYRSDRLLRNHDTQIISVAFHSLVEPFLIEGEWCDVRRPSEHAGDWTGMRANICGNYSVVQKSIFYAVEGAQASW